MDSCKEQSQITFALHFVTFLTYNFSIKINFKYCKLLNDRIEYYIKRT